jgi:hypothetical protein
MDGDEAGHAAAGRVADVTGDFKALTGKYPQGCENGSKSNAPAFLA